MRTLKKIDSSLRTVCFVLVMIFALMLLCSILTPITADDYSYSYSWVTKDPIRSIGEICESLRLHYQVTNGRMIAHFFAHLFLWLPNIVFCICNAAVFTGIVFLIYRLSMPKGEHRAVILPVVFGLIWCVTPAFAQSYLWLVGACNYSWSALFTLLYLFPLLRSLIRGTELSCGSAACVGVLVLSIIAGAYLENVSAAAVFMAFLLLALLRFWQKRKIPWFWYLSLLLSCAGYLSMLLSPGERSNKYDQYSPVVLREHFITALNQYRKLWILLLVLGVLIISAVYLHRGRERVLVAVTLGAGSLAANFIFVFAAYYPSRATFYSALLLVAAIAILLPEVMSVPGKVILLCAVWALGLVTCYQVLIGVNDIYNVRGQFCANEQIIAQAKEQGQLDVTVNRLTCETEYATVDYSGDDNPEDWPNTAIARYYGLNSIVYK